MRPAYEGASKIQRTSKSGKSKKDKDKFLVDMKTLQEYLNENYFKAHNNFTISTYGPNEKEIHIYIHPSNDSGETMDFTLIGNKLITHPTQKDAEQLGKTIMKMHKSELQD